MKCDEALGRRFGKGEFGMWLEHSAGGERKVWFTSVASKRPLTPAATSQPVLAQPEVCACPPRASMSSACPGGWGPGCSHPCTPRASTELGMHCALGDVY